MAWALLPHDVGSIALGGFSAGRSMPTPWIPTYYYTSAKYNVATAKYSIRGPWDADGDGCACAARARRVRALRAPALVSAHASRYQRRYHATPVVPVASFWVPPSASRWGALLCRRPTVVFGPPCGLCRVATATPKVHYAWPPKKRGHRAKFRSRWEVSGLHPAKVTQGGPGQGSLRASYGATRVVLRDAAQLGLTTRSVRRTAVPGL